MGQNRTQSRLFGPLAGLTLRGDGVCPVQRTGGLQGSGREGRQVLHQGLQALGARSQPAPTRGAWTPSGGRADCT